MTQNKFLLLMTVLMAMHFAGTDARAADTRCYEMRTYYSPPGKLDELHARFRNHTLKLFEKHGIQNVGYWVPVENPDQKLIYILSYPSREAREKSWQAFVADPAWQAASKESEKNGKLVAKAESLFMSAVDYSPPVAPTASSTPRLFELRTYATPPGKLADLNARFRDHTLKLFSKYGMTNVGYWTPMTDQKAADTTLIYILAHKDQAARDASFAAFRTDADWVKAKADSEKGGSLTLPDGVKFVMMKPTDYSPLR